MQELIGSVVRSRPRLHKTLDGDVALVTQVDAKGVTFASHTLSEIFSKTVPAIEFAKEYGPDPSQNPWKVAQMLYCAIGPMRSDPTTQTMLKAQLDKLPTTYKEPTMGEPSSKNQFVVCTDDNRRLCMQTYRDKDAVQYIPLHGECLAVHEDDPRDFDELYKPLTDYPPERAAKLFASYAQHLGASKEAMQCLGNVIPLTKQEVQMAIIKGSTATASDKAGQAAAAKAAGKAPKAAPVKAVKANGHGKPAKVKAAKGGTAKVEKVATKVAGKKPSASSEFQRLIMEGQLTDEQIFKQVQKKYGLPDGKRSYVAWYRNHLKKRGEKVPAPVQE